MKKSGLLALSLFFLITAGSARAQVALNVGETWTTSFSGVPQTGSGSIFGSPDGGMEVGFSSFPSCTMKFELWEGGPVGVPAYSGLITGSGSVGAANFLWQDLAGSVRLTMLTGACVVSSVAVVIHRAASGGRFDTFRGNLGLTSAPPALAFQRLPAGNQVSWWTNGSAGYVLETASLLASNQWSLVPASPLTLSNRFVVNVGTNGNAAYFRLRK